MIRPKTTSKLNEFYSLLRVSPDCSLEEVETAYEDSRRIFAAGSRGTYGLVNEEEREQILVRLEEAYQALVEDARQRGHNKTSSTERHFQLGSETEPLHETDQTPVPGPLPSGKPTPVETSAQEPIPLPPLEPGAKVTGQTLAALRNSAAMSLEEMAGKTKLHRSLLQRLENNDFKSLPPRVYVQGYVRLYFKQLQGDYDRLLKKFMEYYDEVMSVEELGS